MILLVSLFLDGQVDGFMRKGNGDTYVRDTRILVGAVTCDLGSRKVEESV